MASRHGAVKTARRFGTDLRVRSLLLLALMAIATTACDAVRPSGPGGEPPPSGVQGITGLERLVADPTAFDGQQITTMGTLVVIDGAPILCSALAEVRPDGCADPRLSLIGVVPPDLVGQTVTVRGTFHAERGPAAMSLDVLEVRTTGA
jgi:hypothetical protein